MKVFLNGKIIDAEDAKVSVFDSVFESGEGLFETIAISDGLPCNPKKHFLRISQSAEFLEMPIFVTEEEFAEILIDVASANSITNGKLRATITRQTFLVAPREELAEMPKVAKVCFVAVERTLPQIKSLNYLSTVLADREAEKRGCDTALLVDRRGFVTEAARANIFWVEDGELHTPPTDAALAGTTQARVLEAASKLEILVTEKNVTPEKLKEADEIFLTSAAVGVWPVVELEKQKLEIGKITRQLKDFLGC